MSAKIRFYKMHGTGNDYVFIDAFKQKIENPAELCRKVSDRHTGIGSDGLVLILPSEKADCKMDIYNADGSRAQMCGNAIRCVGKYLYESGMTESARIRIETLSGIKHLRLLFEKGILESVCVNMGQPVFDPEKIPFRWDGRELPVAVPLSIGERAIPFTVLSMGNPHAVYFTNRLSDRLVTKYGPLIEKHEAFPEGTNAEFVRVIGKTHIQMRVWERGSGETLSCGTGACAAALAGILRFQLDRNVTVSVPGGSLRIFWDPADGNVYMTGPAVTVFQGIYEYEQGAIKE